MSYRIHLGTSPTWPPPRSPIRRSSVVVDEDGFGCATCADEHRQLAAVLTSVLAEQGIELLAAHVVDRVAAGGRWYCADGCGSSGTVEDPSASPLAMAAVLDGRRLYARRAELQQVIEVSDPARRAALADVVRDRQPEGNERADAEARSDIEDAIAAAGQVVAGGELSDDELARLAWALKDPRVRDTLYALAVGENAGQAEALWATLSRTLPDPWRVEALVLLAFSAYVRGDGPLAGVSLDAALRCDPTHRMAGMLDTALQSGMRPERIRELAVTGYRLADQLGVRLPPKRAFGQAGGLIPPRGKSEDAWAGLGDGDGVLGVRGVRPVCRAQGPAVGIDDQTITAPCPPRFERQGHARPQ